MRISIKVSGVDAAANPLLSADRTIRKAAVKQVRKAGNLVKRAAVRNIRSTFSGSRAGKTPRNRLRATMRVRVEDNKVRVTAEILPVGLGRAQGTTLEVGGSVQRKAGRRRVGSVARGRNRRRGIFATVRKPHTADYGSPRPFLEPAVKSTEEKVYELIGGSFDVL